LPKDKMDAAVVYEISNFESIILVNDKGILKPQALPIEAQVSPVKDALVDDFNNDGFKDIIIVGNHYGVEVETVRYDAGMAYFYWVMLRIIINHLNLQIAEFIFH
jgi:hypothetical protein